MFLFTMKFYNEIFLVEIGNRYFDDRLKIPYIEVRMSFMEIIRGEENRVRCFGKGLDGFSSDRNLSDEQTHMYNGSSFYV